MDGTSADMRRTNCVWVQALVIILLVVDLFVRPPYGLLSSQVLSNWFTLPDFLYHSTLGPTETCGWDYEASWKIGFGEGASIQSLQMDDDNVFKNPIVTCALTAPRPISFVADPFLVLNHELPPDQKKTGYTYLLFEMKNLVTGLGEIGAAKSKDAGRSWEYVGEALVKPYHLSYPFVLYDAPRNQYLMFPESSAGTRSVQIFKTTPAEFPLGWTLAKAETNLQGKRFVDTSVIELDQTFYLFTTIEYSLHVYTATDLLGDWSEHPASPVVFKNRTIGRSGGKVTVVGSKVYRFAQDCTNFYGEQVHVFEVELTAHTYQEKLIRTIKRRPGTWNSERFHHVDLHPLPNGKVFAAFDGDEHPEDYEYFAREGWWYYSKRFLLGILIGYTLSTRWAWLQRLTTNKFHTPWTPVRARY
jgi:hypothetical protein